MYKKYIVYTCPYAFHTNYKDFHNYTYHAQTTGISETADYIGLSIGAVNKSLCYDRPVFNIEHYCYYWVKRC